MSLTRREFIENTTAVAAAAALGLKGARVHGPVDIRLRCIQLSRDLDDIVTLSGEFLIDERRDIFGIQTFREIDLGQVELSLSKIREVLEEGLAPRFIGNHNGQEVRAAGTILPPEDFGRVCIWNHNLKSINHHWCIWIKDSDVEKALGI